MIPDSYAIESPDLLNDAHLLRGLIQIRHIVLVLARLWSLNYSPIGFLKNDSWGFSVLLSACSD